MRVNLKGIDQNDKPTWILTCTPLDLVSMSRSKYFSGRALRLQVRGRTVLYQLSPDSSLWAEPGISGRTYHNLTLERSHVRS